MMEGSVVKIIDGKTAKVLVLETKIHPLYRKVLNRKKYFMCQIGDELSLNENDKVVLKSSRPFSKSKKHIIVNKI